MSTLSTFRWCRWCMRCRWICCRLCRWCRWCKGSRRCCVDENKQMNMAAVVWEKNIRRSFREKCPCAIEAASWHLICAATAVVQVCDSLFFSKTLVGSRKTWRNFPSLWSYSQHWTNDRHHTSLRSLRQIKPAQASNRAILLILAACRLFDHIWVSKRNHAYTCSLPPIQFGENLSGIVAPEIKKLIDSNKNQG